jgi:tetratricopeptide (TPR) repeat protein
VTREVLMINDSDYAVISQEEYWKKYPTWVNAWYKYAEYLTFNGEILKAESIYKEGLALKKLSGKIKLAESYLKFAFEYLEYESCSSMVTNILEIYSSFEITDMNIRFLIKHKNYGAAEEFLLELNEAHVTSDHWLTLTNEYEKNKEFSKAILIYEKLIEKTPSNGDVWKRLLIAERDSKRDTSENTIKKSISFEPKYHTAGLTILQNFGSLLNKEYPNGDVAFTIEQKGMKITMVIEHPYGKKEIVEDYLNRYGLVVIGELPPEEFFNDPVAIMDLKRQIINLEADIKWANEKQRMLEGTISNQDSTINYFQEQLKGVLSNGHNVLTSSNNSIDKLIELTKNYDNNINNLVEQLIASAKSEDIESLNSISTELMSKSPNVSEKIKEFVTTTIASASGNAPAWVDFLSRFLP